MTIKRVVLSVITILVFIVVSSSLFSSWTEPQVTGQLQLYQSNLQLQASEWQGDGFPVQDVTQVRSMLLGQDPLAAVVKDYQKISQEAAGTLLRSQQALETLGSKTIEDPGQSLKLKQAIDQQQTLLTRLNLRLGILFAEQDKLDQALMSWQKIQEEQSAPPSILNTATVLEDLWQNQVSPDANDLVQTNLNGWFQNRALEQLYILQDQSQDLATLAAHEQTEAEKTLVKLLAIGTMPAVGSVLGTGLLIFLGVQWLLKRNQSILAINATQTWQVPWDGEIIWQVLIVGFFFVGQFLIPILLSQLGFSFAASSSRTRAIYSMVYYLMMATGGITVLITSINQYRPLPEDWFRFKFLDKWPLWGLGGYFVALPLMISVSLINQQLWQGQGGNNPLLQTVLEENDSIALIIFFITASVAAPLFEEVLFRGFLLPSLSRYMPIWGAIGLSSLIFATAHLSLSEVLPLTVLGAVLGFVYTRSRNLLAPMLLHSAWNSVTMIGLFLLGS